MNSSERSAVRSGNMFTLTLSTPVPEHEGGKEPGDYNLLSNKPKINGVELVGNLTFSDFGIPDLANVPSEALSNNDLDNLIDI